MTHAPHPIWRLNHARAVHLDRPRLLAILNITPDSFADGGRLPTPAHAADAARRAADEGADALDLGAESTRPGAARISTDEQIRRLIPAIAAVRAAGIDLPMTVDTTRAPVARAALDAGADAINDVAAGAEDDAMLALAAERACAIILMHRLAPPAADRYSDRYDAPPAYPGGVVPAVRAFLAERAGAARAAGVPADRVLLDPGLGFGKSVEQNLELLHATPDLIALGHPVLSALSRKSFVGRLGLARDSDPAERLPATLALSVLHLHAGVRVFRVHDVAEHRQALDAAWAALRA
ncbi:dihydropteroate synthase [Nodularia spumigena]|uniref:dihydropteroate synthase n=1 Tax=Nodularia spumigena TaxID=70799 RepID=UPI002B21F966|nr:dihydropteroate synthase [Nodularia spumigena]MEA5613141.1 dihydropteroate synthase [Nodularia spumigena UHCC 0040]